MTPDNGFSSKAVPPDLGRRPRSRPGDNWASMVVLAAGARGSDWLRRRDDQTRPWALVFFFDHSTFPLSFLGTTKFTSRHLAGRPRPPTLCSAIATLCYRSGHAGPLKACGKMAARRLRLRRVAASDNNQKQISIGDTCCLSEDFLCCRCWQGTSFAGAIPAIAQVAVRAGRRSPKTEPSIEEIVVTGYARRASNARSTSKRGNDWAVVGPRFSAADTASFPTRNVAESLGSRVTGVSIASRSGRGGSVITVRGFGPEFNMSS